MHAKTQNRKERYFDELGTVLRTVSYIQLASEPLLSNIKEIRIDNERIYIHDATSRIICYDMQGKVIYKIDAKGAGPGEYVGINAFVINNQTNKRINHLRQLKAIPLALWLNQRKVHQIRNTT